MKKIDFEHEIESISRLFLKKMWANIFSIGSLNKFEKIFLIMSIVLIIIIALYQKEKAYLIFVPIYFYIKTIYQIAKMKLNIFRYKDLSAIFSEKVHVIDVSKDEIVLNSFIPVTDIRNKKERLQIFFNRKIDSIENNKKSFRIVTIRFGEGSKSSSSNKILKKTYNLIDYIKTAPIKKENIPMLLGIDEFGKLVVSDLRQLRHMLISGEMGEGKSTLLHSIIQSLMWYNDNLAFFLIDFKRVTMTVYKNFNNCVFCKTRSHFYEILEYLDNEMDKRYDEFERLEIDNIDYFNRISSSKLPKIILVIDEIADIKFGDETNKTEEILRRLVLMGRAAGIHVITATQRPSGVQLSTEVRAGLTSKISFSVFDKRTQDMTGVSGTENLGTGEFLTSHIRGLTGIIKGLYVDKEKSWEVFNELKEIKGGIVNHVNLIKFDKLKKD